MSNDDPIKFDNLKNLNDDDLAFVEHDLRGESPAQVRIRQEWRRREMLKQHELYSKLVHISIWATGISTITATVVGAFRGAFLQKQPQQTPKMESTQITETSAPKRIDEKKSPQHTSTQSKGDTLKSSSSNTLQRKEK